MIYEDVSAGYAPKEVSFGGYTTKNLHRSADAAKAFQDTIERSGELHPHEVLAALKATDTFMKLNDMHLEQGKEPDERELAKWKAAHEIARSHLNSIGEFIHHMDYWHTHEHELQDIMGGYNVETAGAEMADSYNPQGDQLQELSNELLTRYKKKSSDAATAADKEGNFKLGDKRYSGIIKATKKQLANDVKKYQVKEELSDKTIRSSDKIKVARVIADMLGVENAEEMSPENAINAGLRKIRGKRLTPELSSVVKKMLDLAREVGVKVDPSLVPSTIKEESLDEVDVVDPRITSNIARSILRTKDYMELNNAGKKQASQVGHSLHPTGEGEDETDHARRMKVKYKTESVEDGIETEVRRHSTSSDYKVDRRGRKYPASRIEYTKESVDEQDVSDRELEDMAKDIDHEDDILDLYDDDELQAVDLETGEASDVPKTTVDEQALVEVLSRAERLRASMRFARSASKRAARLKIVLKQHSNIKTLTKRAHRLAIRMMKERLMRKPVEQLSVSEKERVESMIAARKGAIARLALKLIPRVAKIENERLSHHAVTQPASGSQS